ncbi:MAG: thermosome subunit alpha [Halobacteriota archaeon]
MAQQLGNQPVLVLSEDSERTTGRDAQSMNITAGKAVSEAVRTTLGPRGMDKMLVGSIGDVVITNDGVTILDEMDVEHPAAKMIVEVADSQEEETGDGTTTAVVIAGELLKRAEDLLDQDVHPTVIASGYRRAAEKARETLEGNAIDVGADDTDQLTRIAETAMTGKGAEEAKETLADLVVSAVQSVVDDGEIDLDNVKVETVVGGAVEDSELIEGMIIDKDRVHANMPKRVDDARIALIDTPIEVKETETDTEINVSSPDELQSFLDQEEDMLREMVEDIKDAGANVVFCQKGIDDMAQHFLAQEGILAVRRAKKSDMKKLARATGGRVVSNIDDITDEDLGRAGTVEERVVSGDEMIFVEDCENPRSVSIILRGGTEHVVDEIERAVDDALGVVRVTVQDGEILPGGGAPEIQVALALRDFADSVEGREQLAVESFADAVEIIPRTLAENAGLDSIDSLVSLRSRHDGGDERAGLDANTGEIQDMEADGVVEPLRVKTQAVSSATEAAVMILRIDDVIAGGDMSSDDDEDMPDMGGGGMGGMGGMGGAM